MNLIDVTRDFPTEGACLEYLEWLRWPSGLACLKCGSMKVKRLNVKDNRGKTRHIYQCLERPCLHQFTATAGTIFHDSHLPLRKWFMAIALICDAKKGISANQIKRHLGVNYRTAWYLCHRIREAMEESVGSIRRECLDHIIVLSESSLRRTLTSYLQYYLHSRTHLSSGKDSPEPRATHPPELGSVVELPQVGGLHHRYERRAA